MLIFSMILSAPFIIIFCIVAIFSIQKKDKHEVEVIKHPTDSLTHNEIVSAQLENRQVNEKNLSSFDVSFIHFKQCLTAFIKDNYSNAVSWEIDDLNLFLEDTFFLYVILTGEKKKILITKIPTIHGYQFQELKNPATEESPKPKPLPEPDDLIKSALSWIEEHIQQLISLKQNAIKRNADLFEYNELPENLIEQIRDLLEIKGFFLSETDKGYCFRF